MEYLTWSTISQHILVDVFTLLPIRDRFNASLVCKNWSDCFHHPQLWNEFFFKFDTDVDSEGKAITCFEDYCNQLKNVEISFNQSRSISRERAFQVMESLTHTSKKKLQKFCFHFTGHNPLCFNGKVILDKLKEFLSRKPEEEIVFDLSFVDLNRCNIAFDNELVSIFAKQHKSLRVLRLQNSCLVDNVTPGSIVRLVENCVYLQELHTFYHCVNPAVIEALTAKRGAPFKFMSLMCNRSDKFKEIVTADTWKGFQNANREAEVEMKFRSSVPHHLIIPLLSPGIPLTSLHLMVYGWLADELNHIAVTFGSTLRFITFQPGLDPDRKAPPGLESALLELVSRSEKLEELHCFCTLKPEVVAQVKAMRKLKKCTLYTSSESR